MNQRSLTAAKPRTFIQWHSVQTRLNRSEEEALLRVLREGPTLSTGPEGEAFEKEFSAFIGCADAVAVSSCSSALELAAVLSNLKAGDEVIMPAHTFVASAVPFARHGVTVRWADVEADTWVVSPKSVEQLITSRTKVIVVVHLYGMTADMNAILALARKHGLIVVEDCAQAPGARCQGRRVGSIGDFGCFSFQTQKNMTTLGEGGMLTVRDPRAATAARRLRWMGNWPFDGERPQYWKPAMNNLVVPIPGHWPFNFCMGEPNCAVGRLLLKRLDAINAQRQLQARHLISSLSEFPELQFQPVRPDREHVYHLMPAFYDGGKFGKNRDDLIGLLFQKYNLKCGVNYWPINRSELFEKFGFGKAVIPNSDRFFDNMLGIPWWSDMQEAELDDIAERIAEALAELRKR